VTNTQIHSKSERSITIEASFISTALFFNGTLSIFLKHLLAPLSSEVL